MELQLCNCTKSRLSKIQNSLKKSHFKKKEHLLNEAYNSDLHGIWKIIRTKGNTKITTTKNILKNETFERRAESSRNPAFGWWNEKSVGGSRMWSTRASESMKKYVRTYVRTYCTREPNRGAAATHKAYTVADRRRCFVYEAFVPARE